MLRGDLPTWWKTQNSGCERGQREVACAGPFRHVLIGLSFVAYRSAIQNF